MISLGSKRSERRDDLEANVAEIMNRRVVWDSDKKRSHSREVGQRSHVREKKASEASGTGD